MFWISSKIESAILPSRYDYDSNGYSMQNDNTMKKFTVKCLINLHCGIYTWLDHGFDRFLMSHAQVHHEVAPSQTPVPNRSLPVTYTLYDCT